MIFKSVRKLFIALIGTALFASALYAESQAIRIGYITDFTGMGAFFGNQSRRGAELASHDLKQNGISNTLLFEDCGGKPADAVTAAIRLLESEKVEALICDLTLPCTAISPRALSAKKVLIYHSPAISIQKSNPYAFRNFLDYKAACKKLASSWKAKNIKPVSSLMPLLEFGELCLSGIEEVWPEHFTYRYNPGDDLRTAALTLKAKGTQALIHVGYEKDFINLFKLTREQEFFPKHGFMDIMLSDTLAASAGDLIKGATVMGYEELPQTFVKRLNESFPSKEKANVQGAALAYNAVFNLTSAINLCGAEKINCLTSTLKAAPSSALLGFRGFGTDQEEYPVKIR